MRSAILLAASICVVGCGSAEPVGRPPAAASAARMAAPAIEPRADAKSEPSAPCASWNAAKVGAQITERGAALVFTTSEDVSSLRERAADLTLPVPAQSVGPRVDNIHQGVRYVFEVEPTGDVTAVRQEVVEHARRIAKGCGLVLAAPTDKTARSHERAAQRPSEPASDAAAAKKKAHAGASEPSRPARKKPAADKPANGATKTDAKPKPKPAKERPRTEKPPEPSKPDEDKKPKEDKQPVLPRLPGPQPDPIVP